MFDRKAFNDEKNKRIKESYQSNILHDAALNFVTVSDRLNYAYNWTWLDLPIIQMPEDIVLVQEIIWQTKPDIIIETGIAWGGSVVLYASILELLGKGQVLAIDKVLPKNNIEEIMKYNFSNRIKLFEGSSIDFEVVEEVTKLIKLNDKVMVILDSNHTHEHVYKELDIWSPYVTKDNYLIVSDTIIEEIPVQTHRPRSWGHGNNPRTALDQFLRENNKFTRENEYNYKALSSYTRNGYIKMHLKESLWVGVYSNFSEAGGDLNAFNSDIWINKEVEKTLTAIKNYNSKVSSSKDYPLPLAISFELDKKKSLTVLDFGGGMGFHYIDVISKVPDASDLVEYYVVDEKASIDNRPAELKQFSKLYFRDSINEIDSPIDIIHVGSTLQYIENWEELLRDLNEKYRPSYFVFSDLQAGDVDTFVSHQVFYDKKIPHIFLNIETFKSFIRNDLKMKLIFNSKFIRTILGQDKYFPNHSLPETLRIDRPLNLIFSKCEQWE